MMIEVANMFSPAYIGYDKLAAWVVMPRYEVQHLFRAIILIKLIPVNGVPHLLAHPYPVGHAVGEQFSDLRAPIAQPLSICLVQLLLASLSPVPGLQWAPWPVSRRPSRLALHCSRLPEVLMRLFAIQPLHKGVYIAR